jgi:hypothetical protein
MTIVSVSTTALDREAYNSVLTTDGIAYQVGSESGAEHRSWVPFVLNIPKGATIASAIIKLICYANDTTTTCKIKLGFSAEDNAATPGTYTVLMALTQTSNVTLDNNVPSWTAGVEYTYDITTSLQEIVNRAGWVSGNTAALILANNGSSATAKRPIATFEHTTYAEPILVVNYTAGGGNPVAITPYMMF